MICDILFADIGMYIDINMPCLKDYKELAKAIKIDLTISSQLEPLVSQNKDIVILSDIKDHILSVLQFLQKSGYNGNINLILPLPFGKVAKGTTQYKLLSNLSKVKTIAVYDPYKLSKKKYGNIDNDNIKKVINEQTSHLLKKLEELEKDKESSRKYFFDFNKDIYVHTKSLKVIEECNSTKSLDMQVIPYFPYRNNNKSILVNSVKTPPTRPDGKSVCQQLRAIRKEFARLNGIDFNFKECTYNGPCAGTCIVCDNESNELREIAKNLSNVKYPKVVLDNEK